MPDHPDRITQDDMAKATEIVPKWLMADDSIGETMRDRIVAALTTARAEGRTEGFEEAREAGGDVLQSLGHSDVADRFRALTPRKVSK
jgi:hypothetical protein